MRNQKNILLVVPRLNIGGAETYVAALAPALQERGFGVHVASGGGRLAAILEEQGIQHHFVPLRLHSGLAAKMLSNIVGSNAIDIIHANSAAAGIAAVKVKAACKIPVVYTAHGVFGHNQAEMTLRDCDRIICVSDFVRHDAIAKGFPAAILQTIYTGIDLTRFFPDPYFAAVLRSQLHIPAEAFTLVLTARMKNLRDKGHGDILRILTEYPKAAAWHVLMVGKGNAYWQLQWSAWRKGLQQRVHCLGHQLQVERFINAADVVVLPSKFETFGLVLAEGLAMEKAAVAYAVGGTPEVIDDGRTGYLAKAGDVDDLYQKLLQLADRREYCREMGQKGRQYVAEHFSEEEMIKNILDVYAAVTR